MSKGLIGIAMSGGVDSTACAIMLQKNHPVQGFFMRLAQPDLQIQLERVHGIADRLAIGLTVIDLQQEFENRVLQYFTAGYAAGYTPNPCLVCNREIKFGLLLEAMRAGGMDHMASGHYARISENGGLYRLHKGADRHKDQSYFLARLGQHQLSRLLLPLGGQTKEQTVAFVAAHGFSDVAAEESQDVCFLSDRNVGDYLAQRLPGLAGGGTVTTVDGCEIGRHRGLFRHTVGQRRGLGLPDSTPWYVVRLEPQDNRLIVGKQDDLLQKKVHIDSLHWLSGHPPKDGDRFEVRLRSTHRGATATCSLAAEDQAELDFDTAQRAVTPGQFAVLYHDDEVIGSGVIRR